MKKNIVPLILISSIFLVLITYIIIDKVKGNTPLAEGYTINHFDTEIEVFNNNTFSVNEHINVNWEKNGYQGLVRVVPNIDLYTSSDGKSYNSNLNISILQSPELYSTCKKISKKQLKLTIGKPGESVALGPHNYQITYEGNFGSDPHNGFDEIIFHAFGDNWGTKINNPSLSITLPSKVKDLKVNFFADKKRKIDITKEFYYTIDGNTIKASAKDNYSLDGSLTIDILLPDGYFINTQNTYHNISAIICIFALLVCIILFILCIDFMKNNPKINTIEYYPPDGLDSSQLGYIFKNVENTKKLSVSLIMSLVSKGYIKIYNSGTNQYNVFNTTVKDSSSLRNEYNIQLPNDIKFINKSEQKPLSKNEQIIFNKLFERNDVNSINDDSNFYTVFDLIGKELKLSIGKRINVSKYKAYQLISWGLSIISIMLMVLGYYEFIDIQPQYQFLYLFGWISCILSIIPSYLIGAKELYGEKIRLQIDNFKTFIENVETSKLEELVKNDSLYFYKILPYAYVLGLNKIWIDKFKSCAIPNEVHYSMDTVNYFDYYMLDNISDNLHYSVNNNNNNN